MAHISMNSPLGPLSLFEEAGFLVALEWGQAPEPQKSPLLEEAKKQLDAYFDRHLKVFDLPTNPRGTAFQKSVWKQISRINYGETISYGALAKAINSAPRAVGGACGGNLIPIIIPCHRIVGGKGSLTGYSGGDGIKTKEALLRLEDVSL
jgi:methylated-DNA-[protein]-cysteine S-methyltransferase